MAAVMRVVRFGWLAALGLACATTAQAQIMSPRPVLMPQPPAVLMPRPEPVAPPVPLLAPCDAPRASDRVMLVIGNAGYPVDEWPALPNAASDAEAICRAFAAQGFRVIKLENAARAEAEAAIASFAELAASADTAIFYFAGHGFEYAGTNFLVPIDAPLRSTRAALPKRYLDLAGALRAVMQARHAMVFLDACRTRDPVVSVTDADPRGPDGPVGAINLPGNFEGVVFYSTARGRPAFDAAPADQKNSPFAEAVIARLETPDLELNRYFAFVRADVKERTVFETGGPQIPTPYGVLAEDYFFRRAGQSAEPASADVVCQLSGDCDGDADGMVERASGSRGFKIARKVEPGATATQSTATTASTIPRPRTGAVRPATGGGFGGLGGLSSARPAPSATPASRFAGFDPGLARSALAALTVEQLRREDEPQIIGRLLGKTSAGSVARLAETGDRQAQYLYGSMLYQGIGVAKDVAAARVMLEASAVGGTPAAQLEYGYFLDNFTTQPGDKARALELYEAAAKQDWPKAQSFLAYRLWSAEPRADGSGQDKDRALALWRAAAAGGHSYAWYALSVYGRQTDEARQGLIALAASGDVSGDAWLCEADYFEGTGRAALDRCLRAAQEGYAGPMAVLAQLYGTGQMGPASAKEARYWARLADARAELAPGYRAALQPLLGPR